VKAEFLSLVVLNRAAWLVDRPIYVKIHDLPISKAPYKFKVVMNIALMSHDIRHRRRSPIKNILIILPKQIPFPRKFPFILTGFRFKKNTNFKILSDLRVSPIEDSILMCYCLFFILVLER
jgi:hypothetical protein